MVADAEVVLRHFISTLSGGAVVGGFLPPEGCGEEGEEDQE